LSNALLPEFDHEMQTTRRTLERVPEDKLGWKPHQKSMTLGALATHLATIIHWVDAVAGMDSFDVTSVPPTPELKSREELLKAFDENVARARKTIAGISDPAMMKPWSLIAGGKTMFSLPRIAVLRSFVLNHIIHHRGQFSVYLRLNDVPVPSIYGPSADEAGM
ncbi:MAG TPA: DinB family protein, partial [Candidatus Angelobacter sp.]|nr:DinB family protein [Candidatus Angelobacter sp.]